MDKQLWLSLQSRTNWGFWCWQVKHFVPFYSKWV